MKRAENRKTETRKTSAAAKTALGGVFLALCLVSMFTGSFAPGVEMSLFAVSSCAIYIYTATFGLGAGAALYIAACLLGFILLPNKLAIIPFALFFGLYPWAKALLEQKLSGEEKKWSRRILKGVFFLVVGALVLTVFKELFVPDTRFGDLPLPVLAAGGVVVFVAFDIILTGAEKLFRTRMGSRMGSAFSGAGFSAGGEPPFERQVPDIKLWAGDDEGDVSDSDVSVSDSDSDSKPHL